MPLKKFKDIIYYQKLYLYFINIKQINNFNNSDSILEITIKSIH
jgi:hypothetical protein